MAIKTVVIWAGLGPDGDTEVGNRIGAEAERLVKAGVTDGTLEKVGKTTIRVWTTLEAAQGWIDFLNAGTLTPISAVIEQD